MSFIKLSINCKRYKIILFTYQCYVYNIKRCLLHWQLGTHATNVETF